MTKMTHYEPGTPCWVDLSSPEVDASKAFYGALFGWTAQTGPPEAGGYVLFEIDGVPVAGLGPIMNEGQPTAWTTYVSVDDADKAVATAQAAGATVLMESMDVLDVGRMAIFADPTGAVIAVWQPRNHIGAGLVNEPNTLCWNELATRDIEGAKAFYGALFGWQGDTSEMEGMTYTEWKLNDRTIGGMLEMGANFPPQVPPHWLAYFATDDCDATVAKATGLGASVMMPATDIPPGRFAVLADPQGAAFAVIKTSFAPE
jgi:predicted enzyme related to lactoylglutathione lyase